MGYKPKFPRPSDPPGQSSEKLNDLVKEALDALESKSVWITGSRSVGEIQKTYLTAAEARKQMGLPDPYRMESAIPPATKAQELVTDLLYHPGTYMRDVITGSYYEAPPRPPPTRVPSAGRSMIGDEPLKPIEEAARQKRIDELTEKLERPGYRSNEKDFWCEWRFVYKKIWEWWMKDFKKPESQPKTEDPQLKFPF
jgi:hypothetical protein